jgi:hypothetical protein
MRDKGIPGIGSMIGHSFESCYKFIELQKNADIEYVSFLKQKMYGFSKPRLRSYGWEQCPKELFNISQFKAKLLEIVGVPEQKIVWGDKVSNLIGSNVNSNTLFS